MIGYIGAIYEGADLANAGEEIQGWLGLLQTGGEDEVTGKDNRGWPCSYIISKTDPDPTFHFDNFGSRSWSSAKFVIPECYQFKFFFKIIKLLLITCLQQYCMFTSFSVIHLNFK